LRDDFVAKNDEFIAFANRLAQLVAERNPADVAALSQFELDGKPVEQVRTELVGKIGEALLRDLEGAAGERVDTGAPAQHA